MINPFDNSITNNDHVQLLPQSINPTKPYENIITENEEPLYATVQFSNEK